ncbi:MAG: beta-ketoacyl-[acyl-carrier-protein] synthase II [Candidatus Firestonebacteria bacterium RIFOXYC2_FULL_39_67]|nr:MAG: beta-ketoacyl-[acyl-carrier-protein] synthase II [Candidatus Firestonebacteria bacterium RIFOXYD2_FULL_39_29]OGF53365.1 MAG: beta-ketoacyl-[acyl-carrier-protein] synthase II [Candidatus Firestonebacteria bacterium RifOxyC12_full_39_7]OGF53763.1 MAG: beta-ketoacyl-[acyl-carrier-protein] synthase II [Candidatus Firestonebacteria bacterium RIFOXYC2_FULL_39_67]
MKRRVVVTGLGVISPAGNDVNTFWKSLCDGVSCADKITKYDASRLTTQIACEVKGFDPTLYTDKKSARRMDGFTQYAIAASVQAMKDSGLDVTKEDATRMGVIIGSGIGGLTTLMDQTYTLIEKGPSRISPFFIAMMISNMAAGMVSIQLGLKGPSACVVTACASGNNSLGTSYRHIQYGDADVMVAGGSECTIVELAMAGFCSAQAMSCRNDDPKHASRPFDKDRDGFVMGEGSGIVVLEELEHAKARGAKIYAEMVGYGMSSDAYHMTAPPADGEGGARAMQNCINDAGAKPEEVDYVNAHGTSTPLGDTGETAAIKRVFKEHAYKLSVSGTKSMIGHMLGAAGGVEFIATVLSVKNDLITPTINLVTPDPACDLDYVPNKAKQKTVNLAISNSFGFGGHNATVAVKKYIG